MCPPQQDPFLLFFHTFLLKIVRVRGWCPPPIGNPGSATEYDINCNLKLLQLHQIIYQVVFEQVFEILIEIGFMGSFSVTGVPGAISVYLELQAQVT